MNGVPDKVIAFGVFLAIWVVGLAVVGVLCVPVWLRGLLAGVPVPIGRVVGMRLRGNPAGLLVDTAVVLRHRGRDMPIDDIERAYLAVKGEPFTPSSLADHVERYTAG